VIVQVAVLRTVVPIAWAKKNLKEVDYTIPPIDGIDYCFVKFFLKNYFFLVLVV
jgi:hypothetical protein